VVSEIITEFIEEDHEKAEDGAFILKRNTTYMCCLPERICISQLTKEERDGNR